jgi:hypothetical protein
VAKVVDIVRDLLQPGVKWTERHGEARPLKLADVLIVAPYNAQVSETAERLPGCAGRHGRQVPGARGSLRHLLDDHVEPGGGSARDAVPPEFDR